MSCQCGDPKCDEFYLYRDLRGVSTFTGFVQRGESIIWIGKDEKSYRPIINDHDRAFFMTQMRQYD